MPTPVDISTDGPVSFRMDLQFTPHATLGAIYDATTANERKLRK